MAPSQVIREARPCHLYFDLEFVPAVNPGTCGDAFVDALLRLVAAELRCVRTHQPLTWKHISHVVGVCLMPQPPKQDCSGAG